MIDFGRILTMMCCANLDRIDDLYAAAANILINTRKNTLCVLMNTKEESEHSKIRESSLFALAKATKNEIHWSSYPESMSKAAMIESKIAQQFEWDYRPYWILNVDDDYMIPFKTLELLSKASFTKRNCDMIMYGQFDIINYRDHPDWSDRHWRLSELLDFVHQYGRRLLVHHLLDDDDIPNEPMFFDLPGQSTGSHMFSTTSYKNNVSLRAKMREWPKGQRGYDVVLCNEIGKVCWLVGSNAYHTDRTRKILDGKLWVKDTFRDDMKMDGTVSGRVPEKDL